MRNISRRSVLTAAALVAIALPASAQERIVPDRWKSTYERYHYAPAVRVGNVLYLSGVVAGDSVPERQFERAFETLKSVLEASGSTLADVVEMTTYHIRMRDHIDTFILVKDRYMKEPWPAWTAIGIDQLFSPRALVEIRVTALVSNP